jgi:Holliday junction resolvase
LGWYVLKIVKANKNGVPDLLCLKPNDVLFIEVKKPTGVLSKIQEYRIEELSKLNFNVLISTE